MTPIQSAMARGQLLSAVNQIGGQFQADAWEMEMILYSVLSDMQAQAKLELAAMTQEKSGDNGEH